MNRTNIAVSQPSQASVCDKVQVEISIEALTRLFSRGQLCAAELNCLNADSKKAVQQLCLTTCLARQCHSDQIENQ